MKRAVGKIEQLTRDAGKAAMQQTLWMLGVADALVMVGIACIMVSAWYRSKVKE